MLNVVVAQWIDRIDVMYLQCMYNCDHSGGLPQQYIDWIIIVECTVNR